ncbi:MAG: alpha/beta hydrolase, partial [Pseudomonadota bacterium]
CPLRSNHNTGIRHLMPRFTTSDGLSLHFEDQGDGPPVLCLAGLTRNHADFTYLMPHLADYRVIRLDYRGRGQSDYASDFMTYNILREGQDAIELLDHLGIEKTVLIGTSRGGLIAMALACSHAHRLAGVVLNDIGPAVTDVGIERIMDYVGKTPPFANLDQAAVALSMGFAASFTDVSPERWREVAGFMYVENPEGGVSNLYDPKLRDALVGQAGTGESIDLWTLFDGLRSLPHATIRGENSDLFAAETLVAMQDRHPDMIATTVPGRGHVPFLDEPEALAVIRALLDRMT